MTNDTERREVARRLRGFITDDSVYATVDAGYVLHAIGLYYKDVDRIYFSGYDVVRLADLIEPSCDRERLLAIATVMAADSVRSAKQGIIVSPVYILHAARDIAEACGETFGSIRNRELAEWGTSIVPKETIVDRDALLALADEMQRELDECASGHEIAGNLQSQIDRIREALGVSDD